MNVIRTSFAHLSMFSLFLNCKFEIFEMEWEFSLNVEKCGEKKMKMDVFFLNF
jgi:hypothetical protein